MVSGGFDPVHIGHIRMFKEAKLLGDELVVVINCDKWLERKKGRAFMNAKERYEILDSIECIDWVYILSSEKDDVCEAIRLIKPDIFANGGDREGKEDIPEAKLCEEMGIEMVFNVGGGKIQSSSDLLSKYN